MDFNEICRICLKNSKEYIPLESPLFYNNNIKTVQEIVASLGVNFEIDDNLPQNICSFCTNKLKETFMFVDLIRESDETLREQLKNESFHIPEIKVNHSLKLEEPVAILKKDGTIEYKTATKEKVVKENSPPTKKRKATAPAVRQLIACILCGKYLLKSSLPQHMKTIHEKEHFSCPHCNKDFYNKRYLTKHLQLHSNREKTFECGTCQKTFFTKTHLIIHNESHLNITYSCDMCGKSFYRKEGLKHHLKKHLGQTVKCDQCEKQFSTTSDLKIHMRFHDNEFPFKCDICPEKFVIKGNYNYHMKQHKREKFKCSICSVEISQASAYRRHVLIHTGKPFPCPVESCECTFTVRSLLSTHMKSRHDRDLSMEELKFINTNFQVKLRSLSLPLNFDMDEGDGKTVKM